MARLDLKALEALHYLYKRLVSPCLGDVCRFEPRCSDYALAAVAKHGWLRGALLAIRRIIRCNPWCKGGYDPVP